ncbi:GNAT family N-acetyltransferase [Dyadobacter sp. CY356]|uniref:GNAT family N-acetyltransferase n=1 Tax=Dyadobacter sp. CY356 TaxID=2906442 RepID=UPI001F24E897|nr:GNAT family N-acetyltransferase [Dyadobacter sp. CY356]MCF0056773.1 GNAT family N-acetyltransferase [Dyadobacter sp. CY356]
MSLTFITKQSNAIASVFDDLAKLRIAVFRDYPYLYEGTEEYEKEYLKIYSNSGKSFLFAIYDGDKMVGGTTCIPLQDETADIHAPFLEAGLDIRSIFYFGESILLKSYRGLGLGHRFFDAREEYAASFGTFKTTCFCSVERINHPAEPADYRPNDAFWIKRGYKKVPDLKATMEWPDIDETISTPKTMIFWMKDIV